MFLSAQEKIMRALLAGLLLVFAAPTYAADKDEDKAKEVVGAFFKALKAKDIDAAMKTVDVPFLEGNLGMINKPEEIKGLLELALKLFEPEEIMSYEMGKVYDMAGIAKYAKENKKEKLAEEAEKLLGKTGRMVIILKKGKESSGMLIRFKDGKAFIAGGVWSNESEMDDQIEAEQNAVELALRRLPELRTRDDGEIKKKVAEAARKNGALNLGPIVDQMRSKPRIGYCVYAGLFMHGDHYYQGKLIRADDEEFLGSSAPHMKSALTKKYGKPEPGPKFDWMKMKCLHEEVEERCHWNFKATIMEAEKQIEIKVACELTFRKNKKVIVSLIDTEQAELVEKALRRK
jgi:hypothetical protein